MDATLLEIILFAAFGVVAIAGALSVVLARTVIYSALGLLANFCALGALYIALNAEFLGVVQFIVYAGAIVVLFLFALMLVGGRRLVDENLLRPFVNLIAAALGLLLLGELAYLVLSSGIAGQMGSATPEAMGRQGNVQFLGQALFTQYLLPFELASVLLLVGIVGAVVIGRAKRERE